MNNLKKYYGTGRRKTACARVFLSYGVGNIKVNRKPVENYFNLNLKKKIYEPLNIVGIENKFDLYITVKGGGISGQIGAIRHGVARAIVNYNISFKPELKKVHLITRDSRNVERKKCGLKKARKAPQYSKR